MPLSDEERATLKRLQQKEKEPEAPPVGRSVQARVDFGDPKQVALAVKHGFLTAEEAEEGKKKESDDDDDDDDKKDRKVDKPRRKGYFGD